MIVVCPPCFAPSFDQTTPAGTVTTDSAMRIVTGIFGLYPAREFYDDQLVRPWYKSLSQEDLEAGTIGDRSGWFVPGHLQGQERGYTDHPSWLFGKDEE